MNHDLLNGIILGVVGSSAVWGLGIGLWANRTKPVTDKDYPAEGQVWRSAHSGRSFRVTQVETTDWGTVNVAVQHIERSGEDFIVPSPYSFGLNQWYRRLREEARYLVSPTPEEDQDA